MKVSVVILLCVSAVTGCSLDSSEPGGCGMGFVQATTGCICDEASDCWDIPTTRIENAISEIDSDECKKYLESRYLEVCWYFNVWHSRAPQSEDPYSWINVSTGASGSLECHPVKALAELGLKTNGMCCVGSECSQLG